jgi:hypothetical protein
MDYPWYWTPSERAQIEQGDFLFNFPIIETGPQKPKSWSSKAPIKIVADRVFYNLIIISHSCDIADGRLDELDLIQLLPVYGYKEFVEKTQMSKSNQGFMAKDDILEHHLLERCNLAHSEIPKGHFVVDFLNLKVASTQDVRSFLWRRKGPPRIRLCHPYLEKMSSRFANLYSRVGLPHDLKRPSKIDTSIPATASTGVSTN